MKRLLPWVARAIAVAALSLCLFSEWLTGRSMGATGSLLREVQAVFRDPQTQWMVMACLVVYFLTFLLLERTSAPAAKPAGGAGSVKGLPLINTAASARPEPAGPATESPLINTAASARCHGASRLLKLFQQFSDRTLIPVLTDPPRLARFSLVLLVAATELRHSRARRIMSA